MNALRMVWLVMLREWAATVLTPLFWRFMLALSVVGFLMVLALRFVNVDIPQEEWLTDVHVREPVFYLEQRLQMHVGETIPVQKYAVVDESGNFVESIRQTITLRDQLQFLRFILELDDSTFATFRQQLSAGEQEFQMLRRAYLDHVTVAFFDDLFAVLATDGRGHSSIPDEFIQFFPDWFSNNQELVGQWVELTSTNFFREVIVADGAAADLNALLSRNEIVGYFVIPQDFDNPFAEMTFTLSVRASRLQLLDLVNWYRSISSESLRMHRLREDGLAMSPQLVLTQPVELSLEIRKFEQPPKPRVSDMPSTLFLYLPATLLFAFIPTALRLANLIHEEKSSQLADKLLSAVPAKYLLDGKFWGTVLVSVTALGIWAVLLGVMNLLFRDSIFMQSLSQVVPFLRLPIVLNFILFLVLMQAFYGYLLCAILSKANTAQQALQSVMAFTFLSLVPIIPALVATPFFRGNLVANIVSFFPPSTPYVMVARSFELPDWPVYLSVVVVMLVTIWGARKLASKAFAKGIVGELEIKWFSLRKSHSS